MEFYAAMKDEILSLAGKSMELEHIIFSEISQVQNREASCFLSYVERRPNINAAIL
jgi:hypothetical protein